MAFVSRHRERLSIFSLSIKRSSSVDRAFINRKETFVFFSLPELPRIQKFLMSILIFMAL